MSVEGYEQLECKLTVAEIADKSDELARAVQTYNRLEYEKKYSAAKYSKQLKDTRHLIDELGEQVRTGVETRDVPVKREVRGMRMETIRVDTHDVISSRPLEAHERQTGLPLDHDPLDSLRNLTGSTKVSVTGLDGTRTEVSKGKRKTMDPTPPPDEPSTADIPSTDTKH